MRCWRPFHSIPPHASGHNASVSQRIMRWVAETFDAYAYVSNIQFHMHPSNSALNWKKMLGIAAQEGHMCQH